jgi:hypothetical protein
LNKEGIRNFPALRSSTPLLSGTLPALVAAALSPRLGTGKQPLPGWALGAWTEQDFSWNHASQQTASSFRAHGPRSCALKHCVHLIIFPVCFPCEIHYFSGNKYLSKYNIRMEFEDPYILRHNDFTSFLPSKEN